ncbi:hypothetical protein EPR50_G00244170 [Perca flavescens]|uniref:Uncharacterized protein n=1 Tax=Perca flavescens TaxID=8167 RepID=A0A484BXU2_PERFV|nr:hypothetical protein EPR50_G00244170 [Perca flavescens]
MLRQVSDCKVSDGVTCPSVPPPSLSLLLESGDSGREGGQPSKGACWRTTEHRGVPVFSAAVTVTDGAV